MAYPLMAQELREQRELAVATIQRQNELYESVSQQLQDARGELHEARNWATLWKFKTRQYRALHQYFVNLYLAESVRYDCLEDKFDQARVWARLWKRAAKQERQARQWWEERACEELQRRASLEAGHGIRQYKREVQLRAALDGLLRCAAYREYGQCSQCEQRAQIALKGTAHD